MNYNLHQLHIFTVVAQKRSITKASEALYMTQPAVSIQLKQLQEHIGLPLFEFIGKQFFLTEAGEKLLECYSAVAQSLEHLEQEMQSLKGMKMGSLTISVVSSAKYFMPHILGKFREKYPQIKVKLEVTSRLFVKNHLLENETDFGVYSVLDQSIPSENVGFLENPLVFIVAPNSPFANISTLDELLAAPFIYREIGSGTRLKLEEFFKQNNCKPDIAMELATTEAVKQAVMAGLGVSLVTKYAIKQELLTGAVKILAIPGVSLASHWHLMWLPGKQLSPVAREFKTFLIDKKFEFN
jgi:LysR family transcriptional regulator, low CO2-responsive transcriptional regulator